MLGCNQDITLWIRKKFPGTDKEIFVRYVIPVKCKWKNYTEREINGGTANIYSRTVIIIPYFDGISELNIKEGDFAALGVYGDLYDITGEPPYTASENQRTTLNGIKQKLAPNITTIKTVSRNYLDINMKGKHLRITGN